MLKLTTTHIDEIRRYFLSSNEEEQLIIQKSIKPAYLSGFLLDLKKLFNNNELQDDKITVVVKTMGGIDYLEEIKEIQQDYYKQLAICYTNGETNQDIEILIKANHPIFLPEVAFQQDLQMAFLLQERIALKNTFTNLHNETELTNEEIRQAFKLKERQNLKEQFKKIEEEKLHNATIAQDEAKLTPIIPFKWKPLAIAATVVGLVLATTFIIIERNNKPQQIAGNKPNRGQQAVDTLDMQHTKYLKDLLAMNQLLPIEQNINVLKELELGFATKEEKITTRIYYLQESLKSLDEAIASEIQARTSNDGLALILIKQKRDSLNNLANKYSFTNGTINLYLFTKKDIKVFKIDSAYYLIIEGITHECKKNNSLLPIKKVTDKAILNKTAKIIFDNAY